MDPFHSEDRDASRFTRNARRLLQVFFAADVVSSIVLLANAHATCDVPLKLWLVGSVLLGFPTTQLIKRIVRFRPAYRYYRLVAMQLRGGADVANAQWGGLVLYDDFGTQVSQEEMHEMQDGLDGSIWYVSLQHEVMVPSYAVTTHASTDPALDPVSWTFECSVDGRRRWTVLDEMDEEVIVPTDRGESTDVIENLAHVEDAGLVFRIATMAECAASGASLGWMTLGTAWVSAGTDQCIDSAPWLWYPTFLIVTTTWSACISASSALIISAAAAVCQRDS